ncbi:retrovirus-related Pol polyprotein from transposon TNT 1-94 [Trichonephila clavipes]|uniref:Retrovirus-related Pol polyprotein from transposon TNT 1-94 n=1 Tax=Trichonephila clavipes TaxID=2585209 RepID=A0A8X6T6D9_TRICX|nr:retrovirus-related Pol polyprotein from transposon TNT 1-94 [Trichonephila clavipes]
MERGSWSFIEGTEPPLDETTATRRDKSENKQRHDRALATIYYGEQFEPVSRAAVIRLLDEFFSIKFNPDTESIAVFIARIRKLIERLKDVGQPLNDMYCAFQAIGTLSPEFQGVVQILYHWPDEDFKLDKIMIELIAEENRLKHDLKNIEGKTMSLVVGGLESPIEANAERVLNRKIVSVRCDTGMKFCHSKFFKYLNELGIRCERTNTYTPEQNGVSERFNLTAMNCVKSMLNTSGIEKCFWAEALVCFTCVKNRICHKFKDKTPYDLYFGRKPTVSNLKYLIHGPRVAEHRTRGYRIWLPDDKKLIETCNVLFDESKSFKRHLNVPSPNSRKTEWMEFKFDNPFNTFSCDDPDESGKAVVGESSRVNAPVENASNLKLCSSIPFYREAILRQNGKRYDIYYRIKDKDVRLRSFNDVEKYCKDNDTLYDKKFDFNSTVDHNANRPEASNIEILIPRNFKDAKNSPQSDKWQDAMKEEIKVMKERDVWELVPTPQDSRVIGCRSVYTLKTDS